MQNDSTPQTVNSENSNRGYVAKHALTVETDEGMKFVHSLSIDERRVLGRFAISGTRRKKVLENFYACTKNQPEGKFNHIEQWLKNILKGSKSKNFTIQMEREVQLKEKVHLQCEPRTFEVKLNSSHESTCELEFTVIIKCTDEALHEHNNFWCESDSRLDLNNGDIVAVILKLIGDKVFKYCYEQNSTPFDQHFRANSIFKEEGWNSLYFEITKLWFNTLITEDDFEFKSVEVEA
jgi:hypothetical protein